jgi:tetratricopeptide (TPR) repeat protein
MRLKLPLYLLVGILILASCSRKKDKFLNKNFHAMTTYYNIVYNGNLALVKGQLEVEAAYAENYWKVLPLERMITKQNPTEKNSNSENSSFEDAEEKATKSIQKHSMYMRGKEYNPQTDEAFLLLGKARYYDQRFVPAKDAFSFILNHYPESSTINQAKIWVEKVNLRLEYFEMVIDNLTELISTTQLTPLESHEANSTLAQAYIADNRGRQALSPLKIAIQNTQDEEKKARFLYIRGQLFSVFGQTDSARVSFDDVIALNRNSPRSYMIHSELEKLKLEGFKNALWYETELAFQELAGVRENRPFLDFIYYDTAMFNLAKDSVSFAIERFNKSLKEQPKDKYLKSQNYVNLGEIYFDKSSYETSGKYYDSTLINLVNGSREHRQVKRKREHLEDVITFERIATETDSVLNLVKAPEEERVEIFKTYIQKLKEEEKSVFANKSSSRIINSRFGRQKSQIGGGQVSSTTFYFYDITQKQRGEESFRKIWGDIELADDWRKNSTQRKLLDAEEEIVQEDRIRPEYDPQTYIAMIPTDQKVIDSISDERNFAYYQLGIIYKEKFKKYDLAISKLKSLLESNPEERLILPSKYYLFKIYDELGNTKQAIFWKNDILNKHSESRYASILRNPEAYRNDEDNPQNIYSRLYKNYKAGQYQQTLEEIETYTKVFVGNSILPKLELLKARVLAKLEGALVYQKALNYVALTYPQSKEGKYAQKQYTKLEKKPFSTNFDFNQDTEDQYMLVYNFFNDNIEESKYEEFKSDLALAVEGESGLDLTLTEEIYNQNQILLTINGLRSKLGAQGLAEKFINNDKVKKNYSYFVMSQKNYKIAQINKNLEEFLNKTN